MDEKRCSTCHLMRPLSEFNRRASAPDGLQWRCRVCSAAWYEANKDSHKANVRERSHRARAELRARVSDYLLVHPCADCGEQDIRVLDFDHEDPSQKLDDVVYLVGQAASWDRIAAEIAKCSVRCSNCHRRRTAEMFGYWRSGMEAQRREEQRALASTRLERLPAR